MKAIFSEEYYRNNWDRFIKEVPGKHYRNLEKELNEQLEFMFGSSLPEEAMEHLRQIYAKKVVDSVMPLIVEELKTVEAIQQGTVSFGFTTQLQENAYTNEFIQRFEFNCLQLADFKKKYNIG